MAHGKSEKTIVVGFRLPRDVYAILDRRVKGRKGHWGSVAEYLQERIIYDIRREHVKGKSSKVDMADFYQKRRGGNG